jgi:hypothetical protein
MARTRRALAPRLCGAWGLLAACSLPGCGGGGDGSGTSTTVTVPVVEEVALAASGENETLSQLGQSVAALPGGGFAVGWEVGSYPERDVAIQWLTNEGRPLFGPGGAPLASSPQDEIEVVVAPHATSGAFVAYARRQRDGNGSAVVVHSLDGQGRARWPSGVAASDRAGFQVTPHLVPDPSGGVFVCFSVMLHQTNVQCQHLDALGGRMWGASGVDAGGTPGSKVLPRGVSDGAGGLLIFWQNQRSLSGAGDEPRLMEGQRFDGAGNRLWGSTGRIVHQTNIVGPGGHTYTIYSVVSDGQGGAILALDDVTPAPDRPVGVAPRVMAQRVSREGARLWSQGVSVRGEGQSARHEATIAALDGGAFVAVSEDLNRIWLYRLGPDGRHVWPSAGTLASAPAAASAYNAAGSFDGETLWLAWTHSSVSQSLEMDVRLARFAASGRRLDPAEGIVVCDAPSGQFTRGAAYVAAGARLLTVWDDIRRGSFYDVDVYGGLVHLETRRVP